MTSPTQMDLEEDKVRQRSEFDPKHADTNKHQRVVVFDVAHGHIIRGYLHTS